MSDLAFTTMLIGMFVLVVTGLRTAESRFRRSADQRKQRDNEPYAIPTSAETRP